MEWRVIKCIQLPFRVMNQSWRWMVVMVSQQCAKYLITQKCTFRNGYMVNFMVHVLGHYKKKSEEGWSKNSASKFLTLKV